MSTSERRAAPQGAPVDAVHRSMADLEAGLEHVRRSPVDGGRLELIVRRPRDGERECPEEARLDPVEGLVGDNWRDRGSSATPDGSAHPGKQVTLMNARMIALAARTRDRWPLAGDQLLVDMDLSTERLPAGTLLAIGTSVIAVSDAPHTGCRKFVERFGADAMRLVSSPLGRRLRLRGLNARVVRPGIVRVGDVARRA